MFDAARRFPFQGTFWRMPVKRTAENPTIGLVCTLFLRLFCSVVITFWVSTRLFLLCSVYHSGVLRLSFSNILMALCWGFAVWILLYVRIVPFFVHLSSSCRKVSLFLVFMCSRTSLEIVTLKASSVKGKCVPSAMIWFFSRWVFVVSMFTMEQLGMFVK